MKQHIATNIILKSSILILLLLGLLSPAFSQGCQDVLPLGTWQGETTTGAGGVSGNADVTVTSSGSGYVLSDYSAGFIDAVQPLNEDYSVVITLNCDGSVVPLNEDTILGPLEITTGQWDPVGQTLSFDWSLTVNGINQTTTLTFNGQ